MAGHLRRVDSVQPDTRAAAIKCVPVDDPHVRASERGLSRKHGNLGQGFTVCNQIDPDQGAHRQPDGRDCRLSRSPAASRFPAGPGRAVGLREMPL